jgi:signal recognition particle subunit SRP54
MQKMGGLSSMMGMLPGMNSAQMQQIKNAKLDDGMVKRQLAVLSSMTPKERKKPEIIKASRKQRIAAGSGTTVQEVNKLLKQHKDATRVMKRVQKMGKKGMMRGGLGGLMGGGNPFG